MQLVDASLQRSTLWIIALPTLISEARLDNRTLRNYSSVLGDCLKDPPGISALSLVNGLVQDKITGTVVGIEDSEGLRLRAIPEPFPNVHQSKVILGHL
ncbi:MAG: hypothetical protein HY313_04605 [Acidobacteria bacterium]|nr:hypothetical protein [Acidobacteriota bacterium]